MPRNHHDDSLNQLERLRSGSGRTVGWRRTADARRRFFGMQLTMVFTLAKLIERCLTIFEQLEIAKFLFNIIG